MQGRVKFFDAIKGYGFITPASGGKDIFVHISATQRAGLKPLQAEQKIEFEVKDDPRNRGRQCATNLRLPPRQPKWHNNQPSLIDLPIAQDWYKPAFMRVGRCRAYSDEQWVEALRATIEVVVRKLLALGWVRRRTSPNRRDRRAESRYLRLSRDPQYEIRISNHPHPNGYRGRAEYRITTDMLRTSRVADIVELIQRDAAHARGQRKA